MLLQLLGYSAISLLFTRWFEPIQLPKAWVVEKITKFYIRKGWYWMFDIVKIFSCGKCFSFWFTLLITFNLYYAAIVSILTMLINLVIEKLQDNG
jgi:hypothetical protein